MQTQLPRHLHKECRFVLSGLKTRFMDHSLPSPHSLPISLSSISLTSVPSNYPKASIVLFVLSTHLKPLYSGAASWSLPGGSMYLGDKDRGGTTDRLQVACRAPDIHSSSLHPNLSSLHQLEGS